MEFRRTFLLTLIAILALHSATPCIADYKDDMGFTLLQSELGGNMPTGSGIVATQGEAPTSCVPPPGSGCYMPNTADSQFIGKTIVEKSGSVPGFSSHATVVGHLFYGNTDSLSPGITSIDCYEANNYLWSGFLLAGTPYQPIYDWPVMSSPSRVANHSWVGSSDSASEMLRRLDFVVEADEFLQVVGVANSTTNQPLLVSSFNAVSVGRSDGIHQRGSVAVDSTYTAGRVKPDLVAPMSTTSSAAPLAASAAALLIQTGKTPALSTDPQQASTTNRDGATIYNAERSEVIKAALMAGADRVTRNGSFANIVDYRADPSNRSANGLDVRYGVGQLNVYHSYYIIAAGEQNSAEDHPPGQGVIDWYGFDLDPSFGGNGVSNTTGSYYFTADQNHRMLYAALVWNIDINGGTWYYFNSTATLYNLDFFLEDVTDPLNPRLVASSTGTGDNTENLWVPLSPGRHYRLQVKPGQGQGAFLWDYALAWRIIEPPDTDQDGMPDDWEVYYGLSEAAGDADADALNNAGEYAFGTDPLDPDSDDDGFTDGQEWAAGSDPLDPGSVPSTPAMSVPGMTEYAFVAGILSILILVHREARRNQKPSAAGYASHDQRFP
jgi:hypothetical protein